jgi:hypothetical protein
MYIKSSVLNKKWNLRPSGPSCWSIRKLAAVTVNYVCVHYTGVYVVCCRLLHRLLLNRVNLAGSKKKKKNPNGNTESKLGCLFKPRFSACSASNSPDDLVAPAKHHRLSEAGDNGQSKPRISGRGSD